MASVLWWLPGFSVTLGIAEMLNGNMVCGASRYAGGLLIGQILALGMVAGASFVGEFNPKATDWLKVYFLFCCSAQRNYMLSECALAYGCLSA